MSNIDSERASARTLVDPFLDAKLHRPPERDDWVRRERLLELMQGARRHPVTLVAAPAGYGKTILVAQWLASLGDQVAAAWVSLDEGDNDPNRMWSHVTQALTRAGRLGPEVDGRQEGAPGSLLTSTVARLATASEDVILVLDDFHFIHNRTCHEQVQLLLHQLPPQGHVVIVTRADPPLRLGRVRASGLLVEIRPDDLAFTPSEAGSLLERHQVSLAPGAIEALVNRTEGWAAGLYLAALSLGGRADPDAFVRDFGGSNRYIGDYLTEEVLSRQSEEVRSFILTISVLDRFCASLCDHVTEQDGSAALLRDLRQTNLFLVPLDVEEKWFRFHHLFATVARAELELRHADRLIPIHARAAAWFEMHGHVDEAVHHYLSAGEREASFALIQAHWLSFVDAGRLTTVLGWLERAGSPEASSDPRASITEAWLAGFAGNEALLFSRLRAAEAVESSGPLADGAQSVASATAMIRGIFGFGGPVDMVRAASSAVELETDPMSPFYSMARAALGHARYVVGELDAAVAPLAEAAGNDRAPVVIRAMALATQALIAHEQADLPASRDFAERAVVLLERNGPRAVPQVSLAYAAKAQVQAASGQVEEALGNLDRALAVRRQVSTNPWGMIHHLHVHARVAAEAGQVDRAAELLAELSGRLDRYDEGVDAMRARVSAVRRLIGSPHPVATEVDALTQRELSVLRLLRGPMTMREIATETRLSSNTVKTHVRTVYRKLGVHTRTAAVSEGRRRGLV